MHVPGILGLFNMLVRLTICTSFASQMQKYRIQVSCNRFKRPTQWLCIQILNEEEAGLNNEVYETGRTKKENEHIKYNPTLYFGTFD